MKIDTLPIGMYGENSYVVHENGEVLLVDPGAYPKEIQKHIAEDEKVVGIVLTHGHEDHTGAVDDLVDVLHCPVYMHADDFILTAHDNGRDVRGFAKPVYSDILPLGDRLDLGVFRMKIYHTPGHTPGSVCIQIKDVLFTGDTLFAGSIGRTDLPGGSEMDMIGSLRFLRTLPGYLKVYPGHGPSTTISIEDSDNPFLQMI
jgi:glyoxylase-like metal-dependent hydrolase (beta-lactamase superfamily II)